MPELPEVETIRRHLAPHVEGRTLDALEVLDPRWCQPLAPEELAAAVEGRILERLSRRGKYLVWELEDDAYLLVHLRMTGNLLLDPHGAPPYTRVWLQLRRPRAARSPTRAASAPVSSPSARRNSRSSSPPVSASSRSRRTSPPPTCSRSRAPRGRRSRRSCSTRSGSPGSGTSTPTRRCSAPASTRCGPPTGSRAQQAEALTEAVVASLQAGHRGQGRHDRRLPRPVRQQRRLPGPVPHPPARGRAVHRLRPARPQAARRRPRDVRLRALPAEAAALRGGFGERGEEALPGRPERAPGSRRRSRRR